MLKRLYHNKFLRNENFHRLVLILVVLFGFVLIPSISAQSSFESNCDTYYGTPSDANLFCVQSDGYASGAAQGLVITGEKFARGVSFGTFVRDVIQSDPNATPDVQSKLLLKYMGAPSGIYGVVAAANTTILQQRPSSGVDFVQDKVYALQNLGKVSAQEPRSYYQGTGYDLLKPIYGFWGWSVNLVYGIMILIIIVLAFAIMFRQKLSGGVEVTIQNAIPSIALAMILLPFSYALTGLAIDMITLGANAVHGFLFAPGAPGYEVYKNREEFYENFFTRAGEDRGLYIDDPRVNWLNIRDNIDVSQNVDEASDNINIGGTTVDNFALFYLIKQILDLLSGKNQTPSYWLGSIINFLLSLTMIWIGIKIFVKLFQKYLMILLMPIFSPFIFATIAIPGNGSKAIVNYLKTLFSASAAYVATYFMFLLTIIFTNPFFQRKIPNISTATFTPPLLGISDIFGGQSNASIVNLLMSLVGLGIYFSIPKVLENIDAALGVKGAIPDFIKTPWESFQESWRVTTRTAPALAARTAIAAGTLGKNTAFAPWRGYGAARDLIDKSRGMDPEKDYGSWRNQTRRRFASELSAAQRRYDEAKARNDTVGMAKAQAEMTAWKIRGDRYGTGVGFQGEADKAPKLNVKFVWKKNGSPDNEIVFTRADVDAIYTNPTPIVLELGELNIEAENFSLPVGGVVEHGQLDTGVSRIDVAVFDKKPGTFFELNTVTFSPPPPPPGSTAPPTTYTLTPESNVFAIAFTGGSAFLAAMHDYNSSLNEYSRPNLRPDGGNKVYKVKMMLQINNARDFFGDQTFVGSETVYKGGALTEAKGFFKSKPRMFRIQGQGIESSKPVSITVRIQY